MSEGQTSNIKFIQWLGYHGPKIFQNLNFGPLNHTIGKFYTDMQNTFTIWTGE